MVLKGKAYGPDWKYMVIEVYGHLEIFTVLDVNDRSSQDSRYGKYTVLYGSKGHVRSIWGQIDQIKHVLKAR